MTAADLLQTIERVVWWGPRSINMGCRRFTVSAAVWDDRRSQCGMEDTRQLRVIDEQVVMNSPEPF